MAAIKMQPLVIDMGGESVRKFASREDYMKVLGAQAIKISNHSDFEGIYRRLTQLSDLTSNITPLADSAAVFVLESWFDADAKLQTSTFAVVYDSETDYFIEIREM